MKTLTTTVGRIVYAIPFAIFGLMHLAFADGMKGMVPSFVPGGVLWVYITGIALIAASVAIITQWQAKLASLLLALLLLTFVLAIQLPGLGSEATRQMAMVGLLKDTALMGAALTFAGIFEKNRTPTA